MDQVQHYLVLRIYTKIDVKDFIFQFIKNYTFIYVYVSLFQRYTRIKENNTTKKVPLYYK